MVSVVKETNFLISFISNRNIAPDNVKKEISIRGIDVLKVLETAKRERLVYPLCQRLLNDARFDGLSLGIRERIKETYYAYVSQSVSFSQKVKEALNEIDTIGVKVLLFKGPAVDAVLSGMDSLRPRSDIDILVREEDRAVFENRLLSLGYTSGRKSRYPIFEFRQSAVFAKSSVDSPPIHLHRHIINNLFLARDAFAITQEKLWQEAASFMRYANIFCLSIEAQALFLIEHSLKHDFAPLVWPYEIDCLIRRYGGNFNWQKLLLLSREFRLNRPLYFGLLCLFGIFHTPIAQEVISTVRPAQLSLLEKFFLKRLRQHKYRKYLSYAVYVAMQGGLLHKIRYLLRTVFPSGFFLTDSFTRIDRGVRFMVSYVAKR